MKHRIITIDGPAGAGKTTVSKRLARELGCVYVDTGALYRGVAYEIREQGVDWENDTALARFLTGLDLQVVPGKDAMGLISSGTDITAHIRTPEVTMLASATSARPAVRAALLDIQKEIAGRQDAVFEGRDMGTVVFPDARVKFFLFADLTIRARRRYDELPDAQKDLNRVREEMKTRDDNDAERTEAPLTPAPDAIKIDSTHLTVDQVVAQMMPIIRDY